MATERDRLRQSVEMNVATATNVTSSHSASAMTSMKQTLADVSIGSSSFNVLLLASARCDELSGGMYTFKIKI